MHQNQDINLELRLSLTPVRHQHRKHKVNLREKVKRIVAHKKGWLSVSLVVALQQTV